MPATSASPWFNMPFRRYHPYRKVSAFHMTFSQEAPITQKLAMYTIYPADSTAGHLSPVTPLQYDNALHMDEPGRTSSRVYFSKLSTTLPVVPVPKPDGEPGRPGRNGYTMKDVLGWDDMVYNEILNTVRDCAEDLPIKRFNDQNSVDIQATYDKIYCLYPELKPIYADDWVIKGFLWTHLGNRKSGAPKKPATAEVVPIRKKRPKKTDNVPSQQANTPDAPPTTNNNGFNGTLDHQENTANMVV